MTEVLPPSVLLYGRRSARNRAKGLRRRRRCRRHDVEVTHSFDRLPSSSFIPPLRVCDAPRVEAADEDVLRVVGRHLGSLAGEDSLNAARHKLSQAAGAAAESASGRSPPRARRAGRSDHSHERGPWQPPGATCRRATDTRLRIHRIERRLTVPSASAAGFKTSRSLTRSGRPPAPPDEAGGVERRLEDGESRSAGRIPSREALTISMLPASAKPPGGAWEASALHAGDGEAVTPRN